MGSAVGGLCASHPPLRCVPTTSFSGQASRFLPPTREELGVLRAETSPMGVHRMLTITIKNRIPPAKGAAPFVTSQNSPDVASRHLKTLTVRLAAPSPN